MATKRRSGGGRGEAAASRGRATSAGKGNKAASKSKPAAKARAGSAAKREKGGGAKSRARATTPAKRAAGARAKAAPQRTFKKRSQPETLRLSKMSVALTADDVDASMKFYVDGFGFHVKQRWESDGKLMGVELVAGSCMIGLSQDDWAKGRNRTKGVGLSIYAESSQGVDKVAARLRERGVDFEGPTTTEWGWKQVSAKDPDGFRIIVYDEPKKTGG